LLDLVKSSLNQARRSQRLTAKPQIGFVVLRDEDMPVKFICKRNSSKAAMPKARTIALFKDLLNYSLLPTKGEVRATTDGFEYVATDHKEVDIWKKMKFIQYPF